MRLAAPVLATLLVLGSSVGASALLGGTEALTSKPGVTADEALKLAPTRQTALIARTVREGSFVSRGVCAPGRAQFLAKGAKGVGYWRMDCADAETQIVAMPGEKLGQAAVVSCGRAKALFGIDCGAPARRGAAR